ncbi:MAG: polyketide cyclase / dehydrase and lipid transport, partial [Actinobacteria bacterium]|nr:polyketide cyclase / dehydrase and lipid transport [Actinomycetota bacterium]
MSNPTTSKISISAAANDVRAVLFDLANYPSWSTSFKSVTVLASDGEGRPTQVKMSVDAGALKDKPTLN